MRSLFISALPLVVIILAYYFFESDFWKRSHYRERFSSGVDKFSKLPNWLLGIFALLLIFGVMACSSFVPELLCSWSPTEHIWNCP